MHVGGHRHDIAEGVVWWPAARLPKHQFLQALEEIIAFAPVLPAPERDRGHTVGTRRPPETEINASGEQRLKRTEAIGQYKRRMVRRQEGGRNDTDVVREVRGRDEGGARSARSGRW